MRQFRETRRRGSGRNFTSAVSRLATSFSFDRSLCVTPMVSRRGAAGRTENKVDSRRRRETRCMNMGAHTCTLHKPSSPCWSGLSRKFLARPWCTHIRVHGGRTNSRVATDRGRSLLHPSRTSTALLIRLNNSTAVIDPSPPECKYLSRNSHRR